MPGQKILKNLTPEQKQAAIADLEQKLAELDQEDQGIGSKLVRGLDYLGGATRAGLAELAGVGMGGKDFKEALALRKNFPSTSDYLAKMGVAEGAKLSDVFPSLYEEPGQDSWLKLDKGGVADPSARGAAGFVGDVALDPATWVSFGSSALGKKALGTLGAKTGATTALEQLAKSPSRLKRIAGAIPGVIGRGIQLYSDLPAEVVGGMAKGAYKKGILPMIQAAEKKGIPNAAETYYKHNIWGSTKRMARKGDEAQKLLYEARDAIHKQADAAGAVVDVNKAFKEPLAKLSDAIEKRRISPAEGDRILEEMFNMYSTYGGEPGTMLATGWKGDIRNRFLSPSDWNNPALARSPFEQKLAKQTSGALQKETTAAIEDVLGKDLATQADVLGKEGGLFESTAAARHRLADQQAKKPLADALDLLFLSGEVYHPQYATGALATKRIGQALLSPGGQSTLGYWGRRATDNAVLRPMLSGGARRSFLDANNPNGEEQPQQ